ncbi:MAG: FAD-binding oxidoreductase [Clostridiales Family XIII bacterium]|jgi:sarcosine oxidase subunit beta|nr:FAD-binding oxidoreductase [Clostridiales Family XIII bacterium]
MSAFDAIVVGGGVIGTQAAYHLFKEGLEVALVERYDIADGTSSHCDAVVLIGDKMPGIDTEQGYASIQRFKEIVQEVPYDFEFKVRGLLYVCETEPEMEAAAGYVADQVRDGYDMQMLDTKDILAREPYLAKDLIGGFWSSADATLNPYKLCYALVNHMRAQGAKIYDRTNVTGVLLDEKRRVKGVETDRGTLLAKNVINCGGAWAPELARMAGCDLPIQPRKGLCLISEKAFPICSQKVQEFGYMMSKFEGINFTRNVSERVARTNVAMVIEPTDADNFILGGNREFKGFDISAEIESIQAIAERGIRFFPILREMNLIRAYAGVRPYMPDHLPVVSEVDNVPGYYIAAGHEGDGISLSAITGKMIAQLVTGKPTDFNIDKLKYSRLQKGGKSIEQ